MAHRRMVSVRVFFNRSLSAQCVTVVADFIQNIGTKTVIELADG